MNKNVFFHFLNPQFLEFSSSITLLSFITFVTLLVGCGNTAKVKPFITEAMQERRYDEVTFVTSHNAYSYSKGGWVYAQQTYSIEEQLEQGVRGLMLDVHLAEGGRIPDGKRGLKLCHEKDPESNCEITRYVFRPLQEPDSLDDTLITVRKFLENNPQEIITLFLEESLSPADQDLVDEAVQRAGLESYVFRVPLKGHIEWPKIKTMIENNHRLVIFSQNESTNFLFTWNYLKETKYNLDDHQGCEERDESKSREQMPRPLLMLNHFYEISLPFFVNIEVAHNHEKVNSFESIKNRIESCKDLFQKTPNFIAVNFTHRGEDGGAFAVAQWLNENKK